jgi:hypothetical protein
MASERLGLSVWPFAQASTRFRISAESRMAVTGSDPFSVVFRPAPGRLPPHDLLLALFMAL